MTAQVVIFDLFKTLIDIQSDEDDPRTYAFMSTWFAYHGVHIAPMELQDSYRVLCHTRIAASPEMYPDIDIGAVFKDIIGGVSTLPREACDTLVEHACVLFRQLTTKALSIYPETYHLLDTLYPRVRLSLVSNTQRLFSMPELKRLRLARFFEPIVFSSDVGVCKPDPEIFRAALAQSGVEPEHAVFVGDNLFDDIWGAQHVGMQTVWIKHHAPARSPGSLRCPTPDWQVDEDKRSELAPLLLSLL